MKPTENGVYLDVKREDYDRIDRLNFSTIKHMKLSPAHVRAVVMEKAKEDTDALRVGRAVGVATLEPERFRATYAVWDGERRAGKEWERFREKNAGLEILREKEYQQVKAIADAARADEHAAPYLRGGSSEVTILWTHTEPANGVPGFSLDCKGRLDFATEGRAIVDLKTAKDASPDGFARAAWNFDYHVQAAMYVDGYAAAHGGEVLPYVLVVVEKEAPFLVQVYRMPEHMLDMGRDIYRGHLRRVHQCRKDNRWPGYADGPIDLELPRWMRSANDDNDVSGLGLEFGGEHT